MPLLSLMRLSVFEFVGVVVGADIVHGRPKRGLSTAAFSFLKSGIATILLSTWGGVPKIA